jgi:hypothetical protein
MKEAAGEVADLQELLEAAYEPSTQHLRNIVTDPRRLDADELVRVLTGMCTALVTGVWVDRSPLRGGCSVAA